MYLDFSTKHTSRWFGTTHFNMSLKIYWRQNCWCWMTMFYKNIISSWVLFLFIASLLAFLKQTRRMSPMIHWASLAKYIIINIISIKITIDINIYILEILIFMIWKPLFNYQLLTIESFIVVNNLYCLVFLLLAVWYLESYEHHKNITFLFFNIGMCNLNNFFLKIKMF